MPINPEDDIPKYAPIFSLDGYKTRAYVSDIYDGDTIKIIFKYNGVYNKWNCRIKGIDTPELRGGDEISKYNAKKSKEYLKNLIYEKNVTVFCGDFDNFGRLLIDIFYDKNVANDMIENNMANIF